MFSHLAHRDNQLDLNFSEEQDFDSARNSYSLL